MSAVGTTSSGDRDYTDLRGVWTISSGKMALATPDGEDNLCTIQARELGPNPLIDGDIDFSYDLTTLVHGMGVAFRVQDEDNFHKLIADTTIGKYLYARFVNGANEPGSWVVIDKTPAAGDRVRVLCLGPSIEIRIGDVVKSISSTFTQKAQGVGPLVGNDTGGRWDNLACGLEPSLSTAPPPTPSAPSPPTNLVATAGDGFASVTWVAPSNVGSSPLTGYQYLIYRASDDFLLVSSDVGTATSATRTGLVNGVAVYFKVRARNAVGLSEPSTASSPVTPAASLTWTHSYYFPFTPAGTISGSPQVTYQSSGFDPIASTSGSPYPGVPATNYARRSVASLTVAAGDARVTVRADDGVRVYRAGNLEIGQWVEQAATTFTDDYTSPGTAETFQVDYFQAGGLAELSFDVAPVDVTAPPSGDRDPVLWPYHEASPINTPIGTGLASVAWPYPSIGGNANTANWTHIVVQGDGGDDLYTVTIQNNHTGISPHPFQIRVPSGITFPSGDDKHLTLITEDGLTSYGLYGWNGITINDSANTIVCQLGYKHSRIGYGIAAAEDGARAWNGPEDAGLIRHHEIAAANAASTEAGYAAAIPHAIAFMLQWDYLGPPAGPNRPPSPWVWPAGSEDGFANNTSCNAPQLGVSCLKYTGTIPMGSLAFLPQSYNVASSGLSKLGKAIAYAFQRYGGFVTDQSGGGFTIQTELNPPDAATVGTQIVAAINAFKGSLRLATNYGPVGNPSAPSLAPKGGGNPVAPYAPAL